VRLLAVANFRPPWNLLLECGFRPFTQREQNAARK
jgi:hypothetical protein